jgi:uncharacterized protein YceH (UPF0502 family)
MNESTATSQGATEAAKPRWRPIGRIDRRIAGVLIEKAKTTPDQYPMTINGLITGSNQKSNRDPLMTLDEGDVTDALDRLKGVGVVVEIQGSGRVNKFRHLLYEWLGVDKVELAVMGELLLRGAQTEGELRGRASRMEAIADLTTMRTILDNLRAKKLVIDITPAGRGQIISHNLYEPDELEKLKSRHSGAGGGESYDEPPRAAAQPARPAAPPSVPSHASPAAVNRSSDEVQSLRTQIAELRRDLEELRETVRRQEDTIQELRTSLGG